MNRTFCRTLYILKLRVDYMKQINLSETNRRKATLLYAFCNDKITFEEYLNQCEQIDKEYQNDL